MLAALGITYIVIKKKKHIVNNGISITCFDYQLSANGSLSVLRHLSNTWLYMLLRVKIIWGM